MDEAKRESQESGSDSSNIGAGLAQNRAGSDEEHEADLVFKMRRQAILDEARENGIIFDLTDCFSKDLDALEAKLAAAPSNTTKTEPSTRGQSEVTEAFCQAHFARVVDLVQAAPVTVMRQGQPLLVVLSHDQYTALTTGRPAAQPGFAKSVLGDVDAKDLTLSEAEIEETFGECM